MTDLTAQMVLTADAAGVEAGVGRAKRSLKDLGATAVSEGKKASDGLKGMGDGTDKAATKIDAATKNIIGSIQRTQASLQAGKKGTADFYEALANQRGLNVDALKPYLANLRAVEEQTRKNTAAAIDFSKVTTSLGAKSTLAGATTSLGATAFTAPTLINPLKAVAAESTKAGAVATEALQKVGVSAGQTRAALAQLPAQFSDIVVSLQGGQRPLSVLLQQGSQIKDSFGGIVPAAKAVGGAVLAMITPFTVAAAAVATLAVAMFKGSEESVAYSKALILTGNSIGKTSEQLQRMAATIAGTTGTQGDAAEALAALAQSGKVASDSLESVGAAVVSMNRVLGTSVDEAVQVFTKLADEPAKASAKLNEQMHYLNLTTYERIRALEDQGQKEEAAALAQTTYANATTSRLAQVEAQAGVLARAWRALGKDAKEAWDFMQGIGRPKSTGELLSAAQQNVADIKARGAGFGGPVTGKSDYAEQLKNAQANVNEISRKALREQENAIAAGEKAKTDAAKIGASDRIKVLDTETKTNADKRKKAIADLTRDFKTLDKSTTGEEFKRLAANIEEKYKDPKTPKGPKEKAFQDDAGTKMLENLRQQEAALKAQLEVDDKLTDSEKERAKFVQLISDLKTKGTLTADQKSLLASQQAVLAQLDINVAVSKQLELKKEAAKLDEKRKKDAEEFARQVEGINISVESGNQSRRDQYDRTLSTVGLGDRARKEVEAEKSIRREYEGYKRQLTKNASDKDQLGSEEYKAAIDRISASLDEALGDQASYFAKEKEAREDWLNGAKEAFANYADEASNAALHTQEAFTNALKGIEDQFVNLFTGKKFDFKKLIGDIQGDLTRNFVKENITGPLSKLAGDAIGDGGLLSGLLGSKKLGGDRGSSAQNPLFVRMADALGLAGATVGGSSGGGGSLFSSLLSAGISAFSGTSGLSTGAAVAAANVTGGGLDDVFKFTKNFAGRAGGGNVSAGGMYEVNEKGPELLNVGGKSLLMMGNQAGSVTPNSGITAGGGMTVNNVFHLSEPASRLTQDQVARRASQSVQRVQRNS